MADDKEKILKKLSELSSAVQYLAKKTKKTEKQIKKEEKIKKQKEKYGGVIKEEKSEEAKSLDNLSLKIDNITSKISGTIKDRIEDRFNQLSDQIDFDAKIRDNKIDILVKKIDTTLMTHISSNFSHMNTKIEIENKIRDNKIESLEFSFKNIIEERYDSITEKFNLGVKNNESRFTEITELINEKTYENIPNSIIGNEEINKEELVNSFENVIKKNNEEIIKKVSRYTADVIDKKAELRLKKIKDEDERKNELKKKQKLGNNLKKVGGKIKQLSKKDDFWEKLISKTGFYLGMAGAVMAGIKLIPWEKVKNYISEHVTWKNIKPILSKAWEKAGDLGDVFWDLGVKAVDALKKWWDPEGEKETTNMITRTWEKTIKPFLYNQWELFKEKGITGYISYLGGKIMSEFTEDGGIGRNLIGGIGVLFGGATFLKMLTGSMFNPFKLAFKLTGIPLITKLFTGTIKTVLLGAFKATGFASKLIFNGIKSILGKGATDAALDVATSGAKNAGNTTKKSLWSYFKNKVSNAGSYVKEKAVSVGSK
jgi:hypothetical protein